MRQFFSVVISKKAVTPCTKWSFPNPMNTTDQGKHVQTGKMCHYKVAATKVLGLSHVCHFVASPLLLTTVGKHLGTEESSWESRGRRKLSRSCLIKGSSFSEVLGLIFLGCIFRYKYKCSCYIQSCYWPVAKKPNFGQAYFCCLLFNISEMRYCHQITFFFLLKCFSQFKYLSIVPLQQQLLCPFWIFCLLAFYNEG